ERSMSNASVPSSSPSGRSWGELVMGGPPTLSPERCDWGTGRVLRRAAVEKPDDRHCRLLRARREQPRRRRAAEQRDERAALHSITSSARARKDSGIVRPIAFAALTLTTSSNLVA